MSETGGGCPNAVHAILLRETDSVARSHEQHPSVLFNRSLFARFTVCTKIHLYAHTVFSTPKPILRQSRYSTPF